jgi:tRNA nucleotidyltransferase (CCA-adding enzyme)
LSLRLILTHENADFDAIASMLAMVRLDPSATPVLPHRVNRNVQNFMTIYAKALLSTRSHKEVRRQNIELVYVVDTQTFNAVRGMRPGTPIIYIDHHPLNHELEAHERFEGEPLGANTSLLVERIMAEGISLTPQEATFLILGIYEDTGSLSFGSTTVRDMKAATWLVEQGADLDIVSKFLTYPLTDELQPVYREMLQTAQILDIAGHPVLLATATTPQYVPELAGLAQKLRDLYDPNALVLLIQMGDEVQLIGRSSEAAIDIGKLAAYFGGGGHARASAAVINHTHLEAVKVQVIEQLKQRVRPVVRVRELMSSGHITSFLADTPIGTAFESIRQLGHEGFPVLWQGRVVGLLTRHALERAVNHHMLYQPVSDIMDAGHVYVTPDDSVEQLRQTMMDSGWGQMPVIDEAQNLVGIVTRTDLIRLWNESLTRPSQVGMLRDKLRQTLPKALWHLLEEISQLAQAQQTGLFLVGGFVRDLLLDVPNLDVDVVVETNAIAFVTQVVERFGGELRTHQQFNTAKWLVDERVGQALGYSATPDEWTFTLDFATARTEFYHEPTILPTVRQSSIKLDLHRRDFTINALAIRLSPEPVGELLDYYNGERDLREGIIRVLHSLSFVDDPTRMMRAIRFEQRLGFHIESRTAELFHAALPLIQRVSGDRLRNELNLMMREAYPLRNFRRLDELGILGQIHPALRVDKWFEAACTALLNFRRTPIWEIPPEFDDWRVAMFGLFTARLDEVTLDELAETLSIARGNVRHLKGLQKVYRAFCGVAPKTPPSHIVTLLEDFDHIEWVMLWASASYAYQRRLIERFVTTWRFIKPGYSGDALIARGLKPGPIIGIILTELKRALLDGEIEPGPQETAYLTTLIATQQERA